MYVLQEKPDAMAELENGVTFVPTATLKNEHGGIMHILEDDHCYVLTVKHDEGFKMTPWWNSEAVQALRTLPLPT